MKNKLIKYFLMAIITVVALWLSFRDLHLETLKESFLQVDFLWVAAAVFSSILAVYLLGWRWDILLNPRIKLSKFYLFKLNIISQYLNIVSPLRLGELAKSWIPSKQHNISGSYVLGTVLIEKMFDFFAFVILIVTLPAFIVLNNDIKTRSYKMALLVSAVLIVLLIIVAWKREMVRNWIHFFSKILPAKFRQKIVNFLDRGMDAFSLLKSFKTILMLVFYTVLITLASSLANFFMFKAFGFKLGLFEALVTYMIIQVGSAPPSSPGKIGVFEYLTKVGLLFFGINETHAVGYGVMLHIVSYLPKILLGFLFMAGLNMSIKKAEEDFTTISETPENSNNTRAEREIPEPVRENNG